MFRIPTSEKQFIVDNESMTRGNVYSTFNVMFGADKGKIKLNPNIKEFYSTSDDANFTRAEAILASTKDSGGDTAMYILISKIAAGGEVWHYYGTTMTKLVGTDAPDDVDHGHSDMCMAYGLLTVSTTDGLHYVDPASSTGAWTLDGDAAFQNKYIVFHFIDTNRIYLANSTTLVSCDSAYTPATSGAYTQTVSGGNIIICAAAASKRIWYATQQDVGRGNVCHIYEWDGVDTNPLNIFTIQTGKIQAITILNDSPVAIDDRGRLWFYDGYGFSLRDGARLPSREDDYGSTCQVDRNGMITVDNKIYVLIGAVIANNNTSERAFSGVWCYDQSIGFYHYSSPDNCSFITNPYALSTGLFSNTLAMGYASGIVDITAIDKVSMTTATETARTGSFTTQFLESKNLSNMISSIGIKYRKMIDDDAKIEVKSRTWKSIEGYYTITWTAATTFTASKEFVEGGWDNTAISVGDEVMIQAGANTGLIAHITAISIAGVTATITIDRDASTTSGTSYALFNNYELLATITNDELDYKKIMVDEPSSTMIQIKLVMTWTNYFDEVQEIMIPERPHELA